MICRMDGCDHQARNRGLCRTHYNWLWANAVDLRVRAAKMALPMTNGRPLPGLPRPGAMQDTLTTSLPALPPAGRRQAGSTT